MLYCLPYEYDPQAEMPRFKKYLDRVLPDEESQELLQELLGSIFIKNIKFEKMGVLLGSGSNGKSVLLDIVTALLGSNNISSMDLKALTTDASAENNRLHLLGKLLNFAPEINARGEQAHDLIKRLASGEAVTARAKYKNSITISNYAKMMFNANQLPTDVEHTHGFFRRWLIVNFSQTISEKEKNPNLANEIIASELPAILNWIIEGTKRLQLNKKFSPCKQSEELLEQYKLDSDVVALWLDERCTPNNRVKCLALTELYHDFVEYSKLNGYKNIIVSKNLANRIRSLQIEERKGKPLAFYVTITPQEN